LLRDAFHALLRPAHEAFLVLENGRFGRGTAVRKMTFVVQSVGQYSKDAFPASKVYGRVGRRSAPLITCGGVFNSSTGHSTDDIVVFAKLACVGPQEVEAGTAGWTGFPSR
jgi:hypothetical protein